jgi:hypothetical protein
VRRPPESGAPARPARDPGPAGHPPPGRAAAGHLAHLRLRRPALAVRRAAGPVIRVAVKFGAFVVVCMTITVYLAFTIGNIRIDDPFGRQRFQLTASFDDVTGLLVDDNVKVAGVVVGKVTRIRTEAGRAHVTFQVDDDTPALPPTAPLRSAGATSSASGTSTSCRGRTRRGCSRTATTSRRPPPWSTSGSSSTASAPSSGPSTPRRSTPSSTPSPRPSTGGRTGSARPSRTSRCWPRASAAATRPSSGCWSTSRRWRPPSTGATTRSPSCSRTSSTSRRPSPTTPPSSTPPSSSCRASPPTSTTSCASTRPTSGPSWATWRW